MYIQQWEEPLMDIPYYKLSKQLLCYVPPVLLVIGTIGNLLSFVVLMRRPMRRVSAYTYLAVLSIADTMVLYISLLWLWIGEITGMDIKNYSDWTCKIINAVGFTVSDYSVWLLIAVTVERYIATVHSLWAPTMCTLSRARKVIVGILVILSLINCHFFVTTGVRDYNTTTGVKDYNTTSQGVVPICDGKENYQNFIRDIWPWIDTIIYSFIPFVVIMSLNGCIICKVAKARKSRDQLHASVKENTMSDTKRKSTARSSHHESSKRITVMLLTISFAFLLTTLPMNISSVVLALVKPQNSRDASKLKLARTITELLMYTNHSINFFLYLVTGHKFRHQLSILMCHWLPSKSSSWVGDGGSVYTQVETKKVLHNHIKQTNGIGEEGKHQQISNAIVKLVATDDIIGLQEQK